MPTRLLTCQNCGFRFPYTVSMEGQDIVSIGNRVACPRCHALVRADFAVDGSGRFHWIEAYDILRRAQLDAEDLERLQRRIEAARQAPPLPERLANDVGEIAPELGSFLRRYLIPDNPGATWGLLGFLLALIVFFRSCHDAPPAEPPPRLVRQMEPSVTATTTSTTLTPIARAPSAARPTPPYQTINRTMVVVITVR